MKMNTKKGEFARKGKTEQAPSVKIIPLGGLEQIGMNIPAPWCGIFTGSGSTGKVLSLRSADRIRAFRFAFFERTM